MRISIFWPVKRIVAALENWPRSFKKFSEIGQKVINVENRLKVLSSEIELDENGLIR
jgi:hypothetical protein